MTTTTPFGAGGAAPVSTTVSTTVSTNRLLVALAFVAAGVVGLFATGSIAIGLAGSILAAASRLVGRPLTESLRILGLGRPPSWWREMLIGLAGALATLVALGALTPLVLRFAAPPDLSPFAALRGNAALLALWLCIVWTSAALGEEIVFRATLQRWLQARLGSGGPAHAASILLASALFGASHLYQGASGMILSGVAGAIYGALMA